MVSVFLFSLLISIDAFSLAIGFGLKGLKFSFLDCLFLNVINSLSLFISILFSRTIFSEVKADEVVFIGCLFLFFLGMYNIINFFLNKKEQVVKFNSKYSNKDFNKFSMLLLLCLESVVSGFSFLVYDGNIIVLVLLSFVLHFLFLLLGFKWGKSIYKTSNEADISWLSGIIFVLLAITKFF